MNMFCFQCQETAGCKGCTRVGVCGKSAQTAGLQDLLIYVTKGLSDVATKLRKAGKKVGTDVNHLVTENLFITITNANFDDEKITTRIVDTLACKEALLAELGSDAGLTEAAKWNGGTETFAEKAAQVGVLSTENEDIRSLREMIVYGLKGMAAYSKHANALGKESEAIDAFLQETLAKTLDDSLDVEALVALTMETGKYGVDAIRYFLLREIAFGQDGNFNNEALIQRINSDLANDLGNLVSRTVGMIDKYFGGTLPAERTATAFDEDLKAVALSTTEKVENAMEKMFFSDALVEIWNLVRRTNKYIDETQPWILCKDEDKKAELANALYNVAESIRIISILIQPFMPNTPEKIWAQYNITEGDATAWDSTKTWGVLPAELNVQKGETLFPRIDMKKELAELEAAIKASQATSVANQQKKEEKKAEAESEYPAEITIDDFCKVQLKVGEVLESKEVEGSKKLLRNVVKLGDEERVIFSGIKDAYAPGELVGKRVVVAYNLKPRKMMGEMSYGMILCAEDGDGKLSVLTTDDKDFASGSSIS